MKPASSRRTGWSFAWALLVLFAPIVHAQIADLSLTNRVSDETPAIGANVDFTVTVSNAGPADVLRVVVRDALPTGYTYVSHATGFGTYTPADGKWTLGAPAYQSVSLRITARVEEAGDHVDVAEIVAADCVDRDSKPGNGDPAEDDYARARTIPYQDVAPIITGQNPLAIGENAAFRIKLDDLVVTDPDNTYPEDFTLSVEEGPHYTITGVQEITPDPGFTGMLQVGVTVSDGLEDSAPFSLEILVGGPNFIVVMTDDLDARSLDDLLQAGLMPNLQTYFIDRGMDFTRAFVTTPLCCPSRASFLTGKYPHNTTIINNQVRFGQYGLHWAAGKIDDTDTIATRLQALGYTTALIGKYMNGYGSHPELAPIGPAFDPHYIPPGWAHWQVLVDFSTYCVYDYTMNNNGHLRQFMRPPGETEDSAIYQTNVLADLSADYVQIHKDDPNPFFLWVTPMAPHVEECLDAYGDYMPRPDGGFEQYIRPAPEFASALVPDFYPTRAFNEDLSDKPQWAQVPPLTDRQKVEVIQQYRMRAQSMLSVDVLLGRIVAALGPKIDNTVLVFTSDNGWFFGEHRRSKKILAYDEASRVPLYIAPPDFNGPQKRYQTVINNDLEPTILNLALPGYGEAEFDGRSIAPLLLDPPPAWWKERERFLIEYGRTQPNPEIDTYLAVRERKTLYIESYAGSYYDKGLSTLVGLELYDLESDPFEMDSLIRFPVNVPDPVLGPRAHELHVCVRQGCKDLENDTSQ
jgi:N-acetylglucosamine-6-sulfatase